MPKSFLTGWTPALLIVAAQSVRTVQRQMLGASVHLAGGHSGAFYLDTPDRLVLENIIFPYYQLSGDHNEILFIGCDWYTSGYTRRFQLKHYSTMDPDPARARFGAARHQIAPMNLLGAVHPPGTLDLIFCNGIIGWGLNERADADTSFAAAFDALRPGGHLMIGWNDIDPHRPFALTEIPSLTRFDRLTFPPLGAMQHRVEHKGQHVFDFYVKP